MPQVQPFGRSQKLPTFYEESITYGHCFSGSGGQNDWRKVRKLLMAPQVGFEPTTLRLTASRLINKNKRLSFVFYGLPANRLRPSTLLYSHFLSLPAKEIAKVNPAFFRHVFGETLKKLIACSV